MPTHCCVWLHGMHAACDPTRNDVLDGASSACRNSYERRTCTERLSGRISLSIAVVWLVGCAVVPATPLVRPSPDAQGEVVVFREWAFVAGGLELTVGAGQDAFASLANSEKVHALFPVGRHEIFVRMKGAEPTRVEIDVRKGERICLKTIASSSTYAKVIVPVALMASGYHFHLDAVPCPSQSELDKYKGVSVSYQD